jgi:hypothetical protein
MILFPIRIKELSTLETKAVEEAQRIKEEVVTFYKKYHTEIIVVASLLTTHIITKLGFLVIRRNNYGEA